MFAVFRTDLDDVYLNQTFNLNIGNPNIYDLINDINSKLSGYLTCSYDNIQNKITYTRTYTQTSNYHSMFIYPINSGGFFGLNNNVETSSSGTECTNIFKWYRMYRPNQYK